MSAWVLGIDGGGTKTRLWLIREDGQTGAVSVQEGTNLHDVSEDQALASLTLGLEELFSDTGAGPEHIASAAWGAAGVDLPGDQERYAHLLHRLGLPRPVVIQNDVQASHRAAFAHGQTGVMLNAGTGSIAYGRHGGHERRTGGWGDLLGDEGSAYAIALSGLKKVVKALDGRGQPTTLGEKMAQSAGEVSVEALLKKTMEHTVPRHAIAALAPAVAQAAGEGDMPAMMVLEQAAVDLAALVLAVARGLVMPSPVRVCLMGGAFRLGPPLMEPFMEALHSLPMTCQITPADFPPEAGAVLEAMDRLGVIPPDREKALVSTLASLGAVIQPVPL